MINSTPHRHYPHPFYLLLNKLITFLETSQTIFQLSKTLTLNAQPAYSFRSYLQTSKCASPQLSLLLPIWHWSSPLPSPTAELRKDAENVTWKDLAAWIRLGLERMALSRSRIVLSVVRRVRISSSTIAPKARLVLQHSPYWRNTCSLGSGHLFRFFNLIYSLLSNFTKSHFDNVVT